MHEALGLILSIIYTPKYLEPAPTLQGMEVQCVGDCLEPRVVEMEPEGDSDRTACWSHHVKHGMLEPSREAELSPVARAQARVVVGTGGDGVVTAGKL